MDSSTQPAAVQDVCGMLIDLLSETLDVDTDSITPDAEFESLDLDSLVLVELAVKLNQRFEVPVTHEELAEAATVLGTAELLVNRTTPPTRQGAR